MRRLFILRPEPDASETVHEAREVGLDAIAMPLFSITPVEWQAPDPAGFDALLLTSANSVRHGGSGLSELRALPVHAVGEATATAAKQAGFDIATVGDRGVEQLLQTIDPQARLLHLCGQHRTAMQANRVMTAVQVYRAIELPVPPEFASIEGQTVVVHSPRAARRLAELAVEHQIDRSTVRIAAISEAAASAAGRQWALCEAARRPDSATLLALAARLCDNPPAYDCDA